MRTLLIEPIPAGAASLAPTLVQAGHHVVRCHPSDGPAFPCAGLTDAGCPLEVGGPVDLAVAVRDDARAPTAAEAGVTCALRAGVPVVVVGQDVGGPFAPWAEPCADVHDLDEAGRRAIAAAADRRAAPIRAEVERLLAADGVDAGAVRVEVERRGVEARVSIRTEREVPDRVASTLATRAHAVDQRTSWPTTKLAVDIGLLA